MIRKRARRTKTRKMIRKKKRRKRKLMKNPLWTYLLNKVSIGGTSVSFKSFGDEMNINISS